MVVEHFVFKIIAEQDKHDSDEIIDLLRDKSQDISTH